MSGVLVERLQVGTNDVDAARTAVGDLFCPHRLEPRAGSSGVDLTLRSARLGGLAIVELDYGATVQILPERLSTFYLVQVPLRGSARVAQGGDAVLSTAATASVLSPVDQVSMTWGAGNPQLAIYLDRQMVESELTRVLGRAVRTPLRFQLGMPTRSAPVQSWLRTVHFLWEEVQRESAMLSHPATLDAFARAATLQFLETQPHTYTAALRALESAPATTARVAADYLEAHLHEPLTVSHVAAELGVSTRALQEVFRRDLGTTPVALLRELRLHRSRELLQRAEQGSTTVTEVAARAGIHHLGRFSAEYHRRFGESPSTTLRRPSGGRALDGRALLSS